MKKEELQEQYDSVMDEIKSLKNKKKEIEKVAKENGFAVFGGKIKEDKKVYGLFYDSTFYSHFDGHISEAIYDDESGAFQVSEHDFNELKKLIRKHEEEGDESVFEEVMDLDLEFGSENFIESYNFMEHFTIIDENKIRWEYEGDGDQCELCDGSYFELRLTTESEIKSVKTVSKW